MAIDPDEKDWTWVLHEPCQECGIDVSSLRWTDLAPITHRTADRFADLLLADPAPSQRSSDDRWSLLEYACHVRDVFVLFRRRLVVMLEQDDPQFENWDQDVTAIDEDYGGQDRDAVAAALRTSGHAMADAIDAVGVDQLDRPGRRSDGSVFTVASLGRYFVHDPLHHLHDVSGEPLPFVQDTARATEDDDGMNDGPTDTATSALDLRTTVIHLGRGATSTPVTDFDWSPESLAAYDTRFAADGTEGRLVGLFHQDADWPTWERHPSGEEVVVLLTGRADLVQWIDGHERVVALAPNEAIVNPVGVWHTATVHEPGDMLFITPGEGTEHVARDGSPPDDRS
ncbi:MAG: DinB family protein [Actinomycetota bacterium]|nr:DinB family protein [Actinomycetota bacterium]